MCYIARILLFICYTSYCVKLSIVLVNQHVHTVRNTHLKQLVLSFSKLYVILCRYGTINLILYQLLCLIFCSISYLVCSYYQIYLSRVVSTIILIVTYYVIQLEYYHPCAMLVIMPSFLQYQLTSVFILLGKYIQNSQYYYSYRSILYFKARVILSSYYDSYYAQLLVELVNKYINVFGSIHLEQLVLLSS